MDRPDARSVPIIALTANAFKEDVDLVLANGMNGHLAKPLENDKLMEMLENSWPTATANSGGSGIAPHPEDHAQRRLNVKGGRGRP